MPSQLSNKNLIWLDLEMTGLDPEHERIIEIATIITDSELNIIAEGPNLVINQNKSLLDSCLLYTSPSPRDQRGARMPSSA